MWDNMETKVTKLVANMNEIKKLFLMTKGGFGASSSSKMFTVSIVEGSQMKPDGTNYLKDIALTLVPGLVNIKPNPQALMFQYKGHVSQSTKDDIIDINTLEG